MKRCLIENPNLFACFILVQEQVGSPVETERNSLSTEHFIQLYPEYRKYVSNVPRPRLTMDCKPQTSSLHPSRYIRITNEQIVLVRN